MISLEEWEEKTKLTEVQKQAVHDIQEACLDLPLPSSWVNNSNRTVIQIYLPCLKSTLKRSLLRLLHH